MTCCSSSPSKAASTDPLNDIQPSHNHNRVVEQALADRSASEHYHNYLITMSTTSIPSSSALQAPAETHVPCHQTERQARSSPLPPSDWVNQPNTTVTGSAQSHFEFFYQVIFTFVHSALTLLLAPVLKNSQPSTRRSSRRSSQQQHPSSRTQRREIQSFREVDPELAMPTHQSNMTSDNTTRMTPVSSSSSILKSQRRRLPSGGELPQYPAGAMTAASAAAKSVRFPEPKRSRPPLGRISSSIGSSSTSVGSNAASESSSSSISSSSSSSSRNCRGRIVAPRYSPRTHHTTYFMSD